VADLFTLEQVKADPAGDYRLAEWRDGSPLYRLAMTEAEIFQAEREEWLGVLAQLWIAYDREIDPERLTLYQRQFGAVPLGLLQEGVDRAIRQHRFNSVPLPSDVWIAIQAILGSPRDLESAIRQWGETLWSRVHLLDGVATETEPAYARP
jgi:hypothetical protein